MVAIYFIAFAIAALFSVPTQARVVVHPKSVPISYENIKVIKKKEIKKKTFLSQTIQQNSSAYVKQTGFSGQLSTVSFRGLPSRHTLVLLDGVPINGSSSGIFDFSILQSKSIDSIKIIPGASSVLYGANATGGVIELTSHQAVKNQKVIQAEGGSFNTLNGYAGLDKVYDSGNYTVYTEGYRTDGLPIYENTRITGEKGKTSNGGGGAYLNHSFRKTDLSVFIKGAEANLKYDATTTNIPPKPQDNKRRNITLMGTKLTGNSKNYACHHELLMARFNDFSNNPGNSFNDHTKHFGTYNFTYHGVKNSDIHFLVSGDHDRLKQDGHFNKEIRNFGTSVLYNYMIFQNLYIDLGARNDHHKLYDNHQTYSSGISYHHEKSTVFLSYRTGFTPPNLYDLYYESSFTEPNQNLNPEKSASIETGIKTHITENYEIHLSFYQSKTKNFIAGQQQRNGKYKSRNVRGTTRINGIDFNQIINLGQGIDFSVGYTLTNFDRSQTGVASSIPRHKINGILNWNIKDDIDSQVSARWISNRKSSLYGQEVILNNYTIFDFNLTKHLSKSAQIYLKMNNIFDEKNIAVEGFRSPRREVYIGTILTF